MTASDPGAIQVQYTSPLAPMSCVIQASLKLLFRKAALSRTTATAVLPGAATDESKPHNITETLFGYPLGFVPY